MADQTLREETDMLLWEVQAHNHQITISRPSWTDDIKMVWEDVTTTLRVFGLSTLAYQVIRSSTLNDVKE